MWIRVLKVEIKYVVSNILPSVFKDSDDDCLNNGQNLNNLFKSSMNRIDNTHATFLNCLRDWNDPFLLGRSPGGGGAIGNGGGCNNSSGNKSLHHQHLHLSSARSTSNVGAANNNNNNSSIISSGCHRCETCACRSFAAMAAAAALTSSANTTLNNPNNCSHNSSSTANTSISVATAPLSNVKYQIFCYCCYFVFLLLRFFVF